MTEDTGADWAHQQELEHQEMLEEERGYRRITLKQLEKDAEEFREWFYKQQRAMKNDYQ